MSNVATVSFKLPPDYYTVLKAIAAGKSTTVSELVRDTVIMSLDLDLKAAAITSFLSRSVQESESESSEHEQVAE